MLSIATAATLKLKEIRNSKYTAYMCMNVINVHILLVRLYNKITDQIQETFQSINKLYI